MELLGLNIFDIVVIAIILLLSIKGLLNGLIKELFNLIGLIGGIFLASYFHNDLSNYIYENFTNAIPIKVLNLLSLIAIFVLFWIVMKYIAKAIAYFSDSEFISTTSRLGGMVIKMVTTFFILSLITYALSTKPQFAQKFKPILDSSKLYTLLKNSGSLILNMPIVSNNKNNKIGNEQNGTETIQKEQNSTKEIIEHNQTVEHNESNATIENSKEDNLTSNISKNSKNVNLNENNSTKEETKKSTNTEDNSTKKEVTDKNSTQEHNHTNPILNIKPETKSDLNETNISKKDIN